MAQTGERSAASARNEVIEMLKEDHQRAKKAFKAFEKLDPESDGEECEAIVRQTCAELTLHTTLEEECLYPAAKSALEEADLIDEAEVEHQSAKDLIEKLQQMTPDDEKYAATFTVLGEYVQHHVKEEETEMFPQLSKAKQIDWPALCDEMNSRRAELMEELMPEQAGEDAEGEGAEAATRSTAPARSGGRSTRTSNGARPQAKKSSDDSR